MASDRAALSGSRPDTCGDLAPRVDRARGGSRDRARWRPHRRDGLARGAAPPRRRLRRDLRGTERRKPTGGAVTQERATVVPPAPPADELAADIVEMPKG